MAETEKVRRSDQPSYGQILKSSALIGGSSVLNIGFGIVRNKAMALLLGPAGFGLMGLYGAIADLAHSIAGLGINSSGVRQIAEAVGSGEKERIARTVTVLRRISVILGVLGAVLLVAFSRQVSALTFGSNQHAASVALLSLAVLFRLVSAGQGALLQGMRRISDLARMSVLGAFLGTVISILAVFFMGEEGIVPALVGVAAMSIVTSWWYSRKVKLQPPAMTVFEMKREAGSLLKLGIGFMVSGLLTMGAAYAVRTMVLRMAGVEAAGLYQAAWTLGGLYVGVILQAMAADFYPRLTAAASDDTECNRLVNEQAHIGLLMAGPGVIATLAIAPLVITLFYSARFNAAEGILRWICLGMALRVITWPLGFIMMAKGRQTLFVATDLAWTIVNVCLSWACVRLFDLNGAGIAFFGSYVFHGFLAYPIVRRLSGFRWSAANKRTGLFFLLLITLLFCAFYVIPASIATGAGILAALLSGVYSLRVLLTLISLERIPRAVRRLLVWLRLAAPDS